MRHPIFGLAGLCIASLCIASLCIAGLTRPLSAHPGADDRLSHISNKIATNPKQQSLYLQRARLLISTKQYQRASDDLHQADLLGPVINSSYYKGLIQNQQHQYARAIAYFNKALAQHSNDSAVLSARAEAHIALNNINAALRDYQQLLQGTVAPQPSHYLDVAKLALGMSDYYAALVIIDQGITQLGLNPQLQQYAVELCRSHDDIQQALSRHQSLYTMMKNNPSWYIQHAELLIVNKELGAANELLLHAEHLLAQRKSSPSTKQLMNNVRLQQSALAKYH